MDITLESTTDGTKLHIPVNPQEITVESGKDVESISILKLGEVPFVVGDRMAVIGISSFFPEHWDTYCQYTDILAPREYWGMAYKMKNEGKPLRLIITGTPINTLCVIEDFNYDYKGGEMYDIYYTLKLRQWRQIKIRTTEEDVSAGVSGGNTPRSRTDTKPVPKVYKVKSGDSLWSIAKLQLGSGSKWESIYNKNKKVIGSNPQVIRPGMELVMP